MPGRHTQWSLGATPGSVLESHSWHCLGDIAVLGIQPGSLTFEACFQPFELAWISQEVDITAAAGSELGWADSKASMEAELCKEQSV